MNATRGGPSWRPVVVEINVLWYDEDFNDQRIIDWFTNWMIDQLIDWLIDWLPNLL